MNLFDRIITVIERNSRDTERRNLYRERYQLAREREYGAHRLSQIESRLAVLRGMDQEIAYGRLSMPKQHVEIIEDDCGVPEGLVGEWRAPA